MSGKARSERRNRLKSLVAEGGFEPPAFGLSHKMTSNFNNLQDAGGPSKNLVRSVRESLLDS